MVSGFDVRWGSMIILDRFPTIFEWLGIRLEKDTGKALDNALGLLRAQRYFSRRAHLSSSYWSSGFNVQSSTWTRLLAPLNVERETLNLFGPRRRMTPFRFFV